MTNAPEENTFALFQIPSNAKVARELEKRGARVFRFPAVETEEILSVEAQKDFLKKISDFEWIIFTDVFAVEYFLRILEENRIDYFELDAARVCACGEAVSDRLRFVQLHADVIPNSIDENDVFTALSLYLNNELKNLKFLIVKESSLDFLFGKKLRENGGVVSDFAVYKAKIAGDKEFVKLKTLLRGGAVDEFVFTSPEDFAALGFYFAGEKLAEVLSETKVSVTNEIAFQTALENDLRPQFFQ
jgi:uroporphyrinogen-III synthase